MDSHKAPNFKKLHQSLDGTILSKKGAFDNIEERFSFVKNLYQDAQECRTILNQRVKSFKDNEKELGNNAVRFAYGNKDESAFACLIHRGSFKELRLETYEQLIQQSIVIKLAKDYLHFLQENILSVTDYGRKNMTVAKVEDMKKKITDDFRDVESAYKDLELSMRMTAHVENQHSPSSLEKLAKKIVLANVDSSLKKELEEIKKRMTVMDGKLILDKRW